jgi:hypothetical protein
MRLIMLSVCLASILAFVPAVAEPRTDGAGNPFLTSSHSALVLFVPLDAHARQLLRAVVPVVEGWLPPGTEITVTPSAGSGWVDASRGGERNGGAITTDLLARFRQAQGSRSIFLIAVTSDAVYDPTTPQLNFVFGLLQWRGSQFSAAVGTRPMRVDAPARERVRLTKMMLRYIGGVVCGLPRNANPHSVLYASLLGTPDLDRMVATLPARCRR